MPAKNTSSSDHASDAHRTIHAVVAKAARRLWLNDALRRLMLTGSLALAAAVIVRLTQNLGLLSGWFGVEAIAWPWLGGGLAAAALLTAAVWSFLRRPNAIGAAQAVDEGAGLRETLSTALAVERSSDGWSKAVLANARRAAIGVNLREATPIQPPRRWGVPAGIAVALVAIWWVQYDLLQALKDDGPTVEQRREIQVVNQQADEALEQARAIARQAGVQPEEGNGDEFAEDSLNPDRFDEDPVQAAETAALRRLADTKAQLEAEADKREQAVDAFREASRRLGDPGPGPMQKAARALAQGDLQKAQAELQDMRSKLESGEMNAQDREALEQQLKTMSDTLSKAAKNAEAMEQALEQAGLSSSDAQKIAEQIQQAAQQAGGDPQKAAEAAQKALEQAAQNNQQLQQAMEQMSQSQAQQLMQQAQQQGMSGAQCENMAAAMSQAAQALQQGGQQSGQQASQAMGEMAGQMSAAEMAQAEMQNLRAGAGACENAMAGMGKSPGNSSGKGGDSQFARGKSNQKGQGSGSAGKGSGFGPKGRMVDFTLTQEKAETENQGGPIIGSTMVYASQVKGESSATFAAVTEAAKAQAAEAIESKRIPREYEKAVRAYFGRLDARVAEAEQAEQSAPASTEE